MAEMFLTINGKSTRTLTLLFETHLYFLHFLSVYRKIIIYFYLNYINYWRLLDKY
jgi:hypothetical protein